MTPLENERGERLLAIHDIEAMAANVRPCFVLVLASSPAGVLLVHNRQRNVWELPGGWVEGEESASQCGMREFFEESGQTPSGGLAWRALLELEVPGNAADEMPHVRHGALYLARIDSPAPFACNEEIDAIGFWTHAKRPSVISAIDAHLLETFGWARTDHH